MTEFKIACKSCGQKLGVDDTMLGKTFECPKCKAQVSVPKPERKFIITKSKKVAFKTRGTASNTATAEEVKEPVTKQQIESVNNLPKTEDSSTVEMGAEPRALKPQQEDLNNLPDAGRESVDHMKAELAAIMIDDERIVSFYQKGGDTYVFTNLRLIFVSESERDTKSREHMSIPYSSVVRFSKASVDSEGHKAEIRIWVYGQSIPITRKFSKDSSVCGIYKELSSFVLNAPKR